MKKIIPLLFLLLLSRFSSAAKDQTISPEQCRAASTEIIKLSEEAIERAEDRKNIKKLSKLISEWKQRLDSSEDACDLYQDILKASTSF